MAASDHILANPPPADSRRRWLWQLPIWLMTLLVLLPVAVIVVSWGDAQTEIWQHLIETQLGRLLHNTLALLLVVGVWVSLLGVSLAWLTAMCDFPGRRWLDWALMLPLALPTYVVAFVALGLLDFSGPVQTLWRQWFGVKAWFPSIQGLPIVSGVMATVLYPYVYMLARTAFLTQGRQTLDAARLLGLSPLQTFFKVALPMARPAIVAGAALALMETLADFGAVSVFNFDTFTTAIYKAWFGFFSLTAAAQLASLLLLFVLLALAVEQRFRGAGRLEQHERQPRRSYQLHGFKAWLASAYCSMVLIIAFVVPVGQLLVWVIETHEGLWDRSFWNLVGHSVTLAGIAAVLVVTIAIAVALACRELKRSSEKGLMRLVRMGYALPGSVLAVGVMLVFAWLDNRLINPFMALWGYPAEQWLMGSVVALLLAYLIRYFSVGLGPVASGLGQVRPALQEAAQSLGAGRWTVLRQIYLPMLVPGLMSALLLVLVDVAKEMPATLLLRPFGWDTLAVRIYELTSEGEWERAAMPSLLLVLISLLPIFLMMRRSRHRFVRPR